MNRNEAENVDNPFSNLEERSIIPLRVGGKVGDETVEGRRGDVQRAKPISSRLL